MRYGNIIACSNLGHNDDATDFLHLLVIRWRDSIEVPYHLGLQIRNTYEFLQYVLWEYVGVPTLLYVITVHEDVVGTEMEIRCRNGPHPPITMTSELLLLIRFRHLNHEVLTQDVYALHGRHLGLGGLFGLLLYICNRLLLKGRSAHFHTQDDISDLHLGQ